MTEQLIADNFTRQPSSGPAFVQLASDFFGELARNTARLPELKTINIPVKVIWGEFDPYITSDVAKDPRLTSTMPRFTFFPADIGSNRICPRKSPSGCSRERSGQLPH